MDTVLLFSGGPDSATLAYKLKSDGVRFLALTFDFGEEEGAAERRSAEAIANDLHVLWRFADFSSPMKQLYESDDVHILRKVIDREKDVRKFGAGVAISMAASVAAELGATSVHYAIHSNDTYAPDNCRDHFDAIGKAVSVATSSVFTVETPFIGLSKDQVIELGVELNVPFSQTWSCARGSETHCGECDACYSRSWAFGTAGLSDPTVYAKEVNRPRNWTP